MNTIALRRPTGADAIDFFFWWNERESRRFSGGGAPVSWDAHLTWFGENVKNPYWFVGVALDGPFSTRAVGACRVDTITTEHWISIVLDPQARGLGYGTALIVETTARFQASVRETVRARIHKYNAPSLRAFEKAGYVGESTVDGPWRYLRKDPQ